jgi:hypothetical protein
MKTLAAMIGISVLLVGCAQSRSTPAPKAPPVPTWKNVELTKDIEYSGTALVRDSLKDPDSAKFSGLYAVKRIDGQGPTGLCGYVNAKNSYGGYVGKKRFFAGATLASIWDDNPRYGFSSDNMMILDACVNR